MLSILALVAVAAAIIARVIKPTPAPAPVRVRIRR
jgi:hypothetical protein